MKFEHGLLLQDVRESVIFLEYCSYGEKGFTQEMHAEILIAEVSWCLQLIFK